MSYNLFLDDVREPWQAGNYMYPVDLRPFYRLQQWVIVRSYSEFVATIKERGLPEMVSFDHDIEEDQYGMELNFVTLEEYYQMGDRGMTGYDCAKWMIEYAAERNLPIPRTLCHSMNPVGKENIQRLFADKSHP